MPGQTDSKDKLGAEGTPSNPVKLQPNPEILRRVTFEQLRTLLWKDRTKSNGPITGTTGEVRRLLKILASPPGAVRNSDFQKARGQQFAKACAGVTHFAREQMLCWSDDHQSELLYPAIVRDTQIVGSMEDPLLVPIWQLYEKRKAPTIADIERGEILSLRMNRVPEPADGAAMADMLTTQLSAAAPIYNVEGHEESRCNTTCTARSVRYQELRLGRLGDLRVEILSGGETSRFKSTDFKFSFVDIPRSFPPDLESVRLTLLEEAAALKAGAPFQNNPLVYLRKLGVVDEACTKLAVEFGPSTYYQHIPFINRLDRPLTEGGETIRQKYFRVPSSGSISAGCSTFFNVITDGGKRLILTRRGSRVAVARDRIAETVCGTMNLDDDWDVTTETPNPFLTAVREAKEELGLAISPDNLIFRFVVVGLDDPTVGFVGDVKVDETSEAVIEHACVVSQREASEFHAVDFTPEAVSEFLRSNRDNLAPLGKFAVFSSLLGAYGWESVRRAFA